MSRWWRHYNKRKSLFFCSVSLVRPSGYYREAKFGVCAVVFENGVRLMASEVLYAVECGLLCQHHRFQLRDQKWSLRIVESWPPQLWYSPDYELPRNFSQHSSKVLGNWATALHRVIKQRSSLILVLRPGRLRVISQFKKVDLDSCYFKASSKPAFERF